LALTFSFYMHLKERDSNSIKITIWKFFSFYTTLTNLLVCIWIYTLLYSPLSILGKFAANANVSAAVAFYLLTVGVGNYLILEFTKLSLASRISDILIHGVTPVATTFYWLVYINKGNLSYEFIPYWLIYPLSYALYTLAHGYWSRFYPYSFTNIRILGVKRVMINALITTICLLIGATLFVAIGKSIG
jgi:hypothetical protein